MIEPVHHGSSTILLVTFLGHPVSMNIGQKIASKMTFSTIKMIISTQIYTTEKNDILLSQKKRLSTLQLLS